LCLASYTMPIEEVLSHTHMWPLVSYCGTLVLLLAVEN
jgi:hypothetical protein